MGLAPWSGVCVGTEVVREKRGFPARGRPDGSGGATWPQTRGLVLSRRLGGGNVRGSTGPIHRSYAMPRTALLHRAALGLAILVGWAGSVLADPPRPTATQNPEAQTLIAQVQKTYADIDRFDARIVMSIQWHEGPWKVSRQTSYPFLFDRVGKRLLIDRPDVTVVCDGKKLRVQSDAFGQFYLEVDAPPVLDYAHLVALVPFIGDPPLALEMPLMSDDIVAQLSGGQVGNIDLVKPLVKSDPAQHTGLCFDTPQGRMTLWVSDAHHTVDLAELVLTTAGAQQFGGGDVVIRYELDKPTINGQMADMSFAFSADGRDAVSSIKELMEKTGQNPQRAAAGGGASGTEDGQPSGDVERPDAPSVALPALSDGQVREMSKTAGPRLRVLIFWASWSPMSLTDLTKIQKVYDWVAQEKIADAGVYAINVQEADAVVKNYVEKNKLTLPVLMDRDSKTSDAYGLQTVPYTLLVFDGKVTQVYPMGTPDLDTQIETKIKELLPPPPPPPPPVVKPGE
ncbi:MAG: redoxin domain-containing protein [Phycisphaera sp.]|nr:redoxin domain-containing protein [Phycisphaera sp.]